MGKLFLQRFRPRIGCNFFGQKNQSKQIGMQLNEGYSHRDG